MPALTDFARTDPAWQEALHRYKAHKAELKQLKKAITKRKANAPTGPLYCCCLCSCWSDDEPDRIFVTTSNDYDAVCSVCVEEAAAIIAEKRSH
jgi:hypothetical protein